MATIPHEPTIDRQHGRLRERFYSADSYGLVLVMIFSLFLIIVLSGLLRPLVYLTYPLLLVVMLLSLRTSGVPGRIVWAAGSLSGLALIVALVAYIAVGEEPARGVIGAVSSALAGASIVAIVGRLSRHAYVAVETVFGALCIYLLLGLLFGFIYMSSDAFNAGDFFAQGAADNTWDYYYFSYVTLATLGYGDLSPGTLSGQALAILEVLLGQLYLVTVVAAIVGNLLTGRQRGIELDVEAAVSGAAERAIPGPALTSGEDSEGAPGEP